MTEKPIAYSDVPPNVRKLAEHISQRKHPDKVMAAMAAFLAKNGRIEHAG